MAEEDNTLSYIFATFIVGLIIYLLFFRPESTQSTTASASTQNSVTPTVSQPPAPSVTSFVPPSEFYIQHSSGKCLHPFGGASNPTDNTGLVIHEGCDGDRLKFTLTPKGSLKHKTSGKCIHPLGGSANPADGTNLVFYGACDEDRMRFEFSKDGSLRHISSGKCIHPFGGSSNPSNNTAAVIHSGCGESRLQFTRK